MNMPIVTLFKIVKRFVETHVRAFIIFFILIILFEIFYIAIQIDITLRNSIYNSYLPQKLSEGTLSDYPVVINSYEPFLTAQSAVLLDNASKRVLFSKNPELRFSMASTTKVMTALVALEEFAYNDILTVGTPFREGNVIGFQEGEQLYFDDLLYALLLPSGNDAAYVIAENYPGGFDAFVTRMNQKAKELHLLDTHFADPAGLNDDLNYITSLDLARFASEALKNQTLARVVGTKRKVFTDVSGVYTYDVYNLNKLLGTQGVIGLKTGTTEGAGEVLVSAVRGNDREYIIVVMKSEDRFLDTQNILGFIDGNIEFLSPEDLINP